MRQQFLRHTDGCTSLLLFFSGWGAEPSMFADNTGTRGTYDILMLWDYRDTAFDAKVLDGYTEVRVLGWSMGVWAAGRTLSGLKTAPGKRLAVNGTPFPIHDRTGIPEAVFDGTLDSLSERSLGKFRRRMCGSQEALEQLLSCNLHRSVEELREELSAIREAVLHSPIADEADLYAASIPGPGHSGQTGLSAPFSGLQNLPDTGDIGHFSWDHAIAGTGDMIFPAANQRLAWESLDVPFTLKDIPHYDNSLFRQLLYKEDAWTRI